MPIYGLLISFATFICVFISERLANYKKLDGSLVWTGAFWVIVTGVISARIYHVLSYLPYYIQNPVLIFDITKGGLGIFGAIIGGALTTVIILKHKKQPLLKWFDVIAVVLPLGQAIGRWGNFFNSELYGRETGFFLGVQIDGSGKRYHPLFLYESILNIVVFICLLKLFRKNKYNDGTILYIYLGCYGIIRCVLESLRTDSWKLLNIDVAQSISILFIIVSVNGLLNVKRAKK